MSSEKISNSPIDIWFETKTWSSYIVDALLDSYKNLIIISALNAEKNECVDESDQLVDCAVCTRPSREKEALVCEIQNF